MDGCKEERKEARMDGWMGGRMGWTADEQTGQVYEQRDGRTDRWGQHLFQQLSYSGGVASQAGDALVNQHQVAHALGGVLQQAHGPDVVLRDVIPAGALVRLLQVDGGGVHQQSHHAGKVLDKVAVEDLLHKALEGGELIVTQQPVEVLVQDELL